eukprot:4776666-Prymnesium_polylepis.1
MFGRQLRHRRPHMGRWWRNHARRALTAVALCVRHAQHAPTLIAVRPRADTALGDMLSYAQSPQDSSHFFAICLQI